MTIARRRTPYHKGASSKTAGLLLSLQDAHWAALRRNVTEFQLGSPSDPARGADADAPWVLRSASSASAVRCGDRWGRCSRSAGAALRRPCLCHPLGALASMGYACGVC